jgi:molybdopterin synthase catalytic subunit
VAVRVQTGDFDAGAEIAALRRGNPKIGAVATFIGVARDVNDGDAVSTLTLEHYPGMTEKALEGIVAEARARWDVIDILIVHRVGEIRPTEQIVLAAVAGAHRGEAFAACEFVMDYLKTRAPFWKQVETTGGKSWVDAKAADDTAAGRWGKQAAE